MTAIDLDALENLAKAATPGPWYVSKDKVATQQGWIVAIAESTPQMDTRTLWDRKCQQADFIAAANPATVLQLIARLRAAEAVVDIARATSEAFAMGNYDARMLLPGEIDDLHDAMKRYDAAVAGREGE